MERRKARGIHSQRMQAVKKTSREGSRIYKILETNTLTVPKLSLNFRVAMAQARNARGLTQKELGHKTAIKESVIKSYEAGKAVPQNNIIQKIEKVLQVQLPRPPKTVKKKKKKK